MIIECVKKRIINKCDISKLTITPSLTLLSFCIFCLSCSKLMLAIADYCVEVRDSSILLTSSREISILLKRD